MAPVRRRMRGDEAKLGRREAILDVARALGAAQPFEAVTMHDVARKAGLAKGTLYLYFATKEELFLGLVERELWAWFDALDARLETAPKDAEWLARHLASSVSERPLLTRLLAVLHALIERNIDARAARRFKTELGARLERTGARLDELAGWGRRGAELLLTLHALIVGLRQMADPPPVIAHVLKSPALAPLRVDFDRALGHALTSLARGYTPRRHP